MELRDEGVGVRVELRLLGLPAIVDPAGSVLHVLSDKDAALLLMAARPGRLDRGAMLAMLWAGSSPAACGNSLRQRAIRLRRRAGSAVLSIDHLPRLAPGVGLDIDTALDALAVNPDAADGELLAPFDYAETGELSGWVDAQRESWRSRRRDVLRGFADALEAASDLPRALAYARRLSQDDSLDEAAAIRLARLHYRLGDCRAGLEVIERLKRDLERDLGADVGPQARELHELLCRGPRRQACEYPLQILRPPRLVGRAWEWRALEHGHARRIPVLLAGEAGIGKSRLGRDYIAGKAGAIAVAARPSDQDRGLATLGRIVQAMALDVADLPAQVRGELARFVPGMGLPAPGIAATSPVARAVAECLARRGRGMVFVDDLHYADAESLAVITLLIDETRESVRWLLACRSAEMPEALVSWIERDEGAGVQRLDLPLLDVAEIEQLLDVLALPGIAGGRWAQRLHDHTGGNVLFVLETCAALLDDSSAGDAANALPLPLAMDALLARRAARLTPHALRLARLAALCGDDFDLELAAQVFDVSPLDLADAWRELEAASILLGGQLRHDSVREALLGELPRAVARAMHERIAARLQERDGIGDDVVADHWMRAERWAEAASRWQRHALAAKTQGRGEEAWRACEAEASCWYALGEHRSFLDALERAAEHALLSRGVGAAQQLLQRIEQHAHDDHGSAVALYVRLRCELLGSQFARAAATAQDLLALARKLALPRRQLEATLALAQAKAMTGAPHQGLALLADCDTKALCDRLNEPRLEYEHASALSYVLRQCDRRREGLVALERARERALSLGDDMELITCHANLALTRYDLGQTGAALRDAELACELRRRIDADGSTLLAVAELNLAAFAFAVGDVKRALGVCDQALVRAERAGALAFVCLIRLNQTQMWLALGQYARASRVLSGPGWDAALPMHRFRHFVLRHRLSRALGRACDAEVAAALEEPPPHATSALRSQALLERACALRSEDAAGKLHRALHIATECELDSCAARVRAALAYHLSQTGGDAAHAHAIASADELERVWVNDEMPAAWWDCAAALGALGESQRRAEVLRRAADWLETTLLPQTPQEFRPSLCERNAAVRAIRAAAKSLSPQ